MPRVLWGLASPLCTLAHIVAGSLDLLAHGRPPPFRARVGTGPLSVVTESLWLKHTIVSVFRPRLIESGPSAARSAQEPSLHSRALLGVSEFGRDGPPTHEQEKLHPQPCRVSVRGGFSLHYPLSLPPCHLSLFSASIFLCPAACCRVWTRWGARELLELRGGILSSKPWHIEKWKENVKGGHTLQVVDRRNVPCCSPCSRCRGCPGRTFG